jgi:hypothetical protein
MACSLASNRSDGILGEQHRRSFGLDCGTSARGPGSNPGTLCSKKAKLRSDGVRAQQYCDGSGRSGVYKYTDRQPCRQFNVSMGTTMGV